MAKVSKRFIDRAKPALRKYQKVLEAARARDVNESDTLVIASDMLADLLGYARYEEITTEFAVRSQFCDLAVKLGGRMLYLIEVKSIGTDLRENHLNQAINYGAREGVEWVILTTGARWQAHRIRFEQPVEHDLVFEIDLLDPNCKPAQLLEKLYLISREAAGSTEMERYWRQREATSRYVVGHVLLDASMLALVRRQLRRLFPGTSISESALDELLRNEVLKRDVLEGDRASAAAAMVKRAARRRARASATGSGAEPPAVKAPPSASVAGSEATRVGSTA